MQTPLRTRVARAALVVAAGVLGGCSSDETDDSCDDRYRDVIEFQEQVALGSISWAGSEPAIVGEFPPPEGTCRAALLLPGDWCIHTEGPVSADLFVTVDCSKFGRLYTGFTVLLGDVRSLPVGSYPLSLHAWGAAGGVPYETILHVEASAGGAADFPIVVTADFHKSLRLEAISGIFDASLRFELKATDFTGKPNEHCRLCGG